MFVSIQTTPSNRVMVNSENVATIEYLVSGEAIALIFRFVGREQPLQLELHGAEGVAKAKEILARFDAENSPIHLPALPTPAPQSPPKPKTSRIRQRPRVTYLDDDDLSVR